MEKAPGECGGQLIMSRGPMGGMRNFGNIGIMDMMMRNPKFTAMKMEMREEMMRIRGEELMKQGEVLKRYGERLEKERAE